MKRNEAGRVRAKSKVQSYSASGKTLVVRHWGKVGHARKMPVGGGRVAPVRQFIAERGPVVRVKYETLRTQPSAAFSALSESYSISNECLSRLTGASPRTVAYWNSGKQPHRSNQSKLRELTRLFDALSDIMEAKAIGPWLQQPNPAFDGSTPLQVIERGEGDRLWRMIWELREGHSG